MERGMKKALITAGAVTAAVFLVVAANYHIVTGSTVSGVTFQKKMSMSLSETFVNLDSVGNMPMIVARSQYPMFVASMERAVTALNEDPAKICGKDLQMGMTREAVVRRCGRPASTETSDTGAQTMEWATGLLVKTENNLVTYVSSR